MPMESPSKAACIVVADPSTETLALQVERLEEERARVAPEVSRARSEATIRAYNHALREWSTWCAERLLDPREPFPVDVSAYLSSLHAEGLSWSSISVAFAAIKFSLRTIGAKGWEPPRGTPREVQLHFEGLTRILGRAQKGKDPLRLADVRTMVQKMSGLSNRSLRDRALLLTHFWGAFRRSELVSLNFGDVKWHEKGVVLHLEHSKTDQEGMGRDVSILFQADKSVCACSALRRWLARAHVQGDWEPVFRPVDRRDVIGTERLSDGAVAATIKKYAKLVGLDPSHYAGHSMRSGFVTEAAVQGVSTSKIMAQTGHRSFEMVQRYIRHADPFEGNATEGMGKVPPSSR